MFKIIDVLDSIDYRTIDDKTIDTTKCVRCMVMMGSPWRTVTTTATMTAPTLSQGETTT